MTDQRLRAELTNEGLTGNVMEIDLCAICSEPATQPDNEPICPSNPTHSLVRYEVVSAIETLSVLRERNALRDQLSAVRRAVR